MLPEVETYLAVRNRAATEHTIWMNARYAEQPVYGSVEYYARYDLWAAEYSRERNIRDRAVKAQAEKALADLKAATTDPVLLWMIKNLRDYETYMLEVLPELPVTVARLEELADIHEWCSEFDDLLSQAIRDGVIQRVPSNPNNVDEILNWMRSEFDVTVRSARRHLQPMVDKIVSDALIRQEFDKTVQEQAPVST